MSALARQVLFLAAVLGGVAAVPAHAETTVTLPDPYELNDDDTVFYAGEAVVSGAVDTAEGYKLVDLDATQNTETDGSNAIFFDIATDSAESAFEASGDQIAVSVFALDDVDNGFAVPIAYAGSNLGTPGQCNGTTCGRVIQVDGLDRFFEANFSPGQTLRVGIYPSDLCRAIYVLDNEKLVKGCEGSGAPEKPASGDTVSFQLRFAISAWDDSTDLDIDDATEASDTITAKFQADAPSFSCVEPLYFPGDGEILVSPLSFSPTTSSGAAPVDKMIVVAQEDSLPATGGSTFTTNEIVERVNVVNAEKGIGGFQNTTADGEDHEYGIAVTFRNAAGILRAPLNSCGYPVGVRTASISGFLEKSSCFIATAAYGSGEAEPVYLLRRFRDRVLLRSSPGSWLVSRYYEYSPAAAMWLNENPLFRGPVLLALTPVEFFAWMILNPFIAFAISSGAFVVAWSAARLHRRAS